MKKICKKCNKEFSAISSKRMYCSRKCSQLSQIRRIKVHCLHCNKEFEKIESEINNGRGRFCSKDCMYKGRKRPKGLKYNIKKENSTWFKKGHITWNIGKPWDSKFKKKMSESCKGNRNSPKTEFKKGQTSKDKNANWKGGITPLTRHIRQLDEYKKWIKKVFQRDKFTCKLCGVRGSVYLHAHHIYKFKDILSKNNIKNIEDAINCKFLWNINNGVTLCKECHKKLHFEVDQY